MGNCASDGRREERTTGADRQGGWRDRIRFLEVHGGPGSAHLETFSPQAMSSRSWAPEGRGEDSGGVGRCSTEAWGQQELEAVVWGLFVCGTSDLRAYS